MNNQRFKDLPFDETILPLHFVPDEMQMDEWLGALCSYTPSQAAEKILQAICTFERNEIKTSLRIKHLHKIYQFFPAIVQKLQKSYLDSSLPLSNEANRDLEFVVWIYMQLARSFRQCKLKYSVTLGKEHQAGLLYLSLEALTQALLHISLSYKMPMHGFWGLCYDLYARAEQANLIHIEITWDGRKGKSISKVFKHLLIFYVCDMQQFRSRDILTLFECLADYSKAARIITDYEPKWQSVVCVINLNKDLPPQKINANEPRDDLSERFITTVNVANNMYQALHQLSPETNVLHSINQEVMFRALNALGLARKRKFTRVFDKNQFKGLVGLNNLIDYLSLKADIKALFPAALKPSKEASKAAQKKTKTSLNLVPVGEEPTHQIKLGASEHDQQLARLFSYNEENFFNAGAILSPSLLGRLASPVLPPTLCRFEMQDSSAKGYGMVAELSASQVKVGDIIALIVNTSERIEVGLVRRINQLSGKYLRLGIEVVGFESELVFVSNPQNAGEGVLAILLHGVKSLKQPDSLIFNSSLFKLGEAVDIYSQAGCQRCRLHRIVQMTLAAAHVELLKV